jgi:hypothetical protein
MRIRTNFFVTLDGDGFTGAHSYGLPEFLAGCEAVSWVARRS